MLLQRTPSIISLALVSGLLLVLASVSQADEPLFGNTPLFPPPSFDANAAFDPGAPCPPGFEAQAAADAAEGPGPGSPSMPQPHSGLGFQDFSVQSPQRTFPDCRLPLLSWRLGYEPGDSPYGPNGTPLLPAHNHRLASWYVQSDLVALRRDGHFEQVFAEDGILGLGDTALSSQDFDYPLDAGLHLLLGYRFSKRLSFEASYLGWFEWQDQQAVRNDDFNLLLGQGNLSSPFTDFGFPPVLGLDFNDFVSVESTSNLENLELMFRYRPDWVPYGAFDVSALYGLRYVHMDETLGYHSETPFPGPGIASNDFNVATDNDMIGAQLGLSMHFLIIPSFWIDWDVKGGIYNNHARQRTVYQNIDENGGLTSFENVGQRDDTGFTGDVRLIANFQLLPRLTLRAGYQATWLESVATGVGNFETDLDIIRFGPEQVDTQDHVVYHGPVLGLMWLR